MTCSSHLKIFHKEEKVQEKLSYPSRQVQVMRQELF